MKIIPAIDIIDGKCVRLTQGDYAQKKVYNENPVAVAREFEASGLRYLHVVDLDGAKAGKVTNWNVIESLCSQTNLTIDFGGGIKTREEIEKLFALGVNQVNLGSVVVKKPLFANELFEEFGAGKIILSADVKKEQIAISGWQEDISLSIFDLLAQFAEQLQYVTCTDIATDGMLSGPNMELYKKIMIQFPALKLTASGGVSCMDDLRALSQLQVDGVIIGKAIYENKITLNELSTYVN